MELAHQHDVARLCWHARGDYFASVCPSGNTRVRPAPQTSSFRLLKRRRFPGARRAPLVHAGCACFAIASACWARHGCPWFRSLEVCHIRDHA